jgi:hypothetical protein
VLIWSKSKCRMPLLSPDGDGRSSGHGTEDGGKERLWLRMAMEGGYLQDHMYVSNLIQVSCSCHGSTSSVILGF